MSVSQKDLDDLQAYWDLTGLAANLTPESIAVMLSAVRSQPTIVQSSKINFMQSKGRSMRSKPPVKQEITCEFKRVEKAMRPYRGMAYRITVHVPYDMRLALWEPKMTAWCFNQWGHAGRLWRNDRGYFYFDSRQKAAMFKLAWHGTTE